MADVHVAKIHIEQTGEAIAIWKWCVSREAEDGDPTGERLKAFKEKFDGRVVVAGYDEFGMIHYSGAENIHHYLHAYVNNIDWEIYQD